MTSNTTKRKPSVVKPTNATSGNSGWLMAAATVIKEIGILGFIIAFSSVIFIAFSTSEQKSYFIDKYILLKNVETDPYAYVLVLLGLIFGMIFQQYFHNMRLKIALGETERLRNIIEKTQ